MAGLPLLATPAAADCYDPDALTSAERSLRTSLGFKAVSDDPQRRCGGCALYTPVAGACGKCALFSGGPVPAQGRCDSWAARK